MPNGCGMWKWFSKLYSCRFCIWTPFICLQTNLPRIFIWCEVDDEVHTSWISYLMNIFSDLWVYVISSAHKYTSYWILGGGKLFWFFSYFVIFVWMLLKFLYKEWTIDRLSVSKHALDLCCVTILYTYKILGSTESRSNILSIYAINDVLSMCKGKLSGFVNICKCSLHHKSEVLVCRLLE